MRHNEAKRVAAHTLLFLSLGVHAPFLEDLCAALRIGDPRLGRLLRGRRALMRDKRWSLMSKNQFESTHTHTHMDTRTRTHTYMHEIVRLGKI